MLEQLLKGCRIWTHRSEGKALKCEWQPPPICAGLCREWEQQERAPGRGGPPSSGIRWTNPPALSLEPQLQKWGSPTCRGQKDLESGTHLCPRGRGSPSVGRGRVAGCPPRGPGLLRLCPRFPGLIPGLPSRKPFLSTLKRFNLLHPRQRAPREAARTPGLRAIKRLTAGGAGQARVGARGLRRDGESPSPEGTQRHWEPASC